MQLYFNPLLDLHNIQKVRLYYAKHESGDGLLPVQLYAGQYATSTCTAQRRAIRLHMQQRKRGARKL